VLERGHRYDTFKQTMSRARKHLGTDAGGRPHLGHAEGGAYRLGPGVGCDWIIFQELVVAAEGATPPQAMELYRRALELVRGEPFAHVAPQTYVWVWSESVLAYEMGRVIADAATRLAELALDCGDGDTASWATRQGLLATPAQLSLFEMEMRAAAVRRDVDGLNRGFRALHKAHTAVDPRGEVPAATVALYRHRWPRSTKVGARPGPTDGRRSRRPRPVSPTSPGPTRRRLWAPEVPPILKAEFGLVARTAQFQARQERSTGFTRLHWTPPRVPAKFHPGMSTHDAASPNRRDRVGPYGRQPVYRVLRERGVTQARLAAALSRPVNNVNGVVNGFWAPAPAFVRAVADFLDLPATALFSEELLESTALRGRGGRPANARRPATPGRFGRQPAYSVLQDRGLRQVQLAAATARTGGYVNRVLNGAALPDAAFVEAVAGFLGLGAGDLFTPEVVEASSAPRSSLPSGAPPSRRVGRFGRQPAYWVLRSGGIRQGDLVPTSGHSGGYISAVLNGFSLPDSSFVEALTSVTKLHPGELFTTEVLDALERDPGPRKRSRHRRPRRAPRRSPAG